MTTQPAPASKRLAAFAWDYLVIAGYIVVLAFVTAFVRRGVFGEFSDAGQGERWRYDLLAFVTLVLPVILYFAISEASSTQATWGKRRLGLRVVAHDGDRLGAGRSLLRSALKALGPTDAAGNTSTPCTE